MTTPTQTILQGTERLLAGPHNFLWSDIIPAGPNGPCVTVFGDGNADFGSINAGVDGCTLSRGSTLQSGLPVTFTGTTLVQCVADINAIFGIVGGAPTNFAYPFNNTIVLWDSTVGLNIALAGVDDLTGANEAAKNQTFSRCGLPNITRDAAAAPNIVRRVGTLRFDDMSCLSTDTFPIPLNTTALIVEAATGSSPFSSDFSSPTPAISLCFSDGTAIYEPAGKIFISEMPGPLSFVDPNPAIGLVSSVGPGNVLSFAQSDQSVFVRPPGALIVVPVYSRSRIRVPVPPVGATLVRVAALAALPISQPSWRGANVSIRAWAIG